MPLLDEIQSDAEKIGAVNTVVNQKGRLIGYNTDVTGFLAAMKAECISLQGKAIVILGAGGAARAVLWGMLKERAGKIMIGGREKDGGASPGFFFRWRYRSRRLGGYAFARAVANRRSDRQYHTFRDVS